MYKERDIGKTSGRLQWQPQSVAWLSNGSYNVATHILAGFVQEPEQVLGAPGWQLSFWTQVQVVVSQVWPVAQPALAQVSPCEALNVPGAAVLAPQVTVLG